jgi:glycine hydroxymethyltransferase
MTSRGMGKPEMEKLAEWMEQVVHKVNDEAALEQIAAEVKALLGAFPAPGIPV